MVNTARCSWSCGNWPSTRSRWLDKFFCVFMDWDWVKVHKLARKDHCQYPAIFTEQAWSIEDSLLRWFPHNFRAIMAKIKLPEKPSGMLLFWIQLLRTYQSSQADPARENWTWSSPYFTWKRGFDAVKNTVVHALSIVTMFDIRFLKNAWEFNCKVTWRNELQ